MLLYCQQKSMPSDRFLSSETKHYLGLQSPVLHRSRATGAAVLIFMPFGAPKGHTKHYPFVCPRKFTLSYADVTKGTQEANGTHWSFRPLRRHHPQARWYQIWARSRPGDGPTAAVPATGRRFVGRR